MASFYCCLQDGDICMGNSSDPWRSPENPKWLGGTGRSRGVISDAIKNVLMTSPQFKIWKNSRWQFAYDACDCMKLHSSRPLYTTHTGSLSFTITTRRLLRRSLRLPNENGHKARQGCNYRVHLGWGTFTYFCSAQLIPF